MSLTSYRAAPPRDISTVYMIHQRLFRFGGDLLSHVLRRSTIGATALNGRVRDGIGCIARAMTTKPKKMLRAACCGGGRGFWPAVFPDDPVSDSVTSGGLLRLYPSRVLLLTFFQAGRCFRFSLAVTGSNQAYRAISTSQLNALPHLHLWPIDVVVFHGSQGRPCFEGGFPLRCLQRLSCPNIATQHYRWHDNWSTSGSFTPVLSY